MKRKEDLDPVFFETREELRQWYLENHAQEDEVYIGFYKKASGKPSIGMKDGLEEGLCFGWVDSIMHSLGKDAYCLRYTKRKKGSPWSERNIKKFKELRKLGLTHLAGVKAFEEGKMPDKEQAAAESRLEPELEEQFQDNKSAWRYFQGMSPAYRKQAIRWVMRARQTATRQRRLKELIADSAAGQKIKPLR